MGAKTDQSSRYNKYAYACLLCSILVNIFFSYDHLVSNKWSLSWSTSAAAEAEAVASISCSGHGRAYLDGLVVDGRPICECNTCYDGPDCSNYIPDCPSDVNSGDPLFLEPFWMQNAASSALVVAGWHRMSYSFGDHTFTSQELEKSIRKLHSIAGNAVAEGKYIVFGTGSTQLLNAAVHALSLDNSSTPSKVVVSIPFYPAYELQTEFFATEDYEFYGDTSLCKNSSEDSLNVIEFVTSPNNPDGKLRKAVLNGPYAKSIHDHAYNWPHFTAIPSPSDEDLMIFTLSKLTGHAGVRFGWALIKDKDVYERMSTYTDDNTFGVSRDSQLRALKLLKVVLEGDGRSIFKYAYETMRKRWEGLSQAVSLSTRFTIQEIAPRFCTFFQHVRGPSPGLPYFDKDPWKKMSNDSFAVALRNLGGTHTIPKSAAKSKSGSGKNDESGSSQQGAAGGESSVAVEKVALGMTAEVQESGSPDLVTRGTKRKQPSARKAPAKVPKARAGRGKEMMVEFESDTDESEDPEREDTRVVLGAGKYSAREIIKLMSGIPTDEDWVKMDDAGLVSTFREIGSLWGQLGARLAGFNTMAFDVIKSERDTADACGERTRKAESSLAQERSAKEKLESEMDKRVKEVETRMQGEWKKKVDDAEARAADAEKKASGFEEEVGALKKVLEERKEAGVVIAEFQKSTAYADALNHAAAAEVVRCWHVAERHIKSDPEANLQSFIELYLAAKDNIKAGKGEPEPYEGPTPSFIARANPDISTTSDVPVDPGSNVNRPPANDPPLH